MQQLRSLLVELYVVRAWSPPETLEVDDFSLEFIYNCFVVVHGLYKGDDEPSFEDPVVVCNYHIHDQKCSSALAEVLNLDYQHW